MTQENVSTCDVHDLFSRMRQTSFRDLAPERLTVCIPDYVPPVVIANDAERWMIFAAELIQSWGERDVDIRVAAHYEDQPDPADACVVLSVLAVKSSADAMAAVECGWLDKIGMLASELLARSVALTVHSAGDSLAFDFRLPAYRSGTRRLVHRDTILLVEDDTNVLRAGKEVLELNGYRVIAESSSEAAVRACEEHRDSICLVISDVMLPGEDGRVLEQAVHTALPEVPVLLISGYSDMDCEDPERRVYFLSKPFNSRALVNAAGRCLAAKAVVSGGLLAAHARPQKPATAWC